MKRFLIAWMLVGAPSLLFGLSTGPFIQISLTGGNGATPLLAVAANGNAFAAWLNFPNNIQTAFFNASINSPTGAWTSLGTLAVGNVPQIGVDQNGNAFIVWVSTSAGTGGTQILVSRFTVATMTFATPVQLSTSGTINFAPQLSVNAIGVAVVIWQQNAPFQVVGASFTPMTGIWSAPVTVFSNTYPATFALDSFNRGIALFNSQSPTPTAIQAARIFAP
jgi:hypothetical protein